MAPRRWPPARRQTVFQARSGAFGDGALAAVGLGLAAHRPVTRRDLVLVSSKCTEDFCLVGRRHLELVERARENLGHGVEFLGRDPELAVGLLKPEPRPAGPRALILERPTRDVSDPQSAHPLQAGQSVELLLVPLAQP